MPTPSRMGNRFTGAATQPHPCSRRTAGSGRDGWDFNVDNLIRALSGILIWHWRSNCPKRLGAQVSHTNDLATRDRGRTTDCRFRLDPRTVLDPQTSSIPRQFNAPSAARIRRPLLPRGAWGLLRAGRDNSTPPSPAGPGPNKQDQTETEKEKGLRDLPPNGNSPSPLNTVHSTS
jgi:hypothetical protein